jgi:hypothetical protein
VLHADILAYRAVARKEIIMFDDVIGLSPDEAKRWARLVEECRPVLAREGMEAVQALLADAGTSVIQAVAITRALLGRAETPLRAAIDTVASSAARSAPGNDG